MKTPTKEIQYLGQMLTCTDAGDTIRINAIIARLTEINTREILRELNEARDAYKNMRDFAEANGLDTVTRNPSANESLPNDQGMGRRAGRPPLENGLSPSPSPPCSMPKLDAE